MAVIKKKGWAGLWASLALAAVGQVQAGDVTSISFEIVNNTAASITLNRSSWDRSLAAPGYFDVGRFNQNSFDANYSTNFTYPSKVNPQILRETLSYKEGERECTFTLDLKVYQSFGVFSPTVRATRAVDAKSTGVERVKCYADVVEYDNSAPFDFSVQFIMTEPD